MCSKGSNRMERNAMKSVSPRCYMTKKDSRPSRLTTPKLQHDDMCQLICILLYGPASMSCNGNSKCLPQAECPFLLFLSQTCWSVAVVDFRGPVPSVNQIQSLRSGECHGTQRPQQWNFNKTSAASTFLKEGSPGWFVAPPLHYYPGILGMSYPERKVPGMSIDRSWCLRAFFGCRFLSSVPGAGDATSPRDEEHRKGPPQRWPLGGARPGQTFKTCHGFVRSCNLG